MYFCVLGLGHICGMTHSCSMLNVCLLTHMHDTDQDCNKQLRATLQSPTCSTIYRKNKNERLQDARAPTAIFLLRTHRRYTLLRTLSTVCTCTCILVEYYYTWLAVVCMRPCYKCMALTPPSLSDRIRLSLFGIRIDVILNLEADVT